jgi:3-oxoacyl-[acyl-carrier protein] reductase
MLEGKLALVTGASRGIGQAIAAELAKNGAKVIGTATTEDGAKGIRGPQLEGRVLNVRDDAACDALLKDVGDVAILVNNAGITRDNLALRMKDGDFDEVVQTNLRAVFRLSRGVMRGMMKARWGRIINITSVVGASGNPGQANYAAAKAGIVGFTKTAAIELAGKGVTVNAIAPGFIATQMIAAMPDDVRARILEKIPMGRFGRPEEIAQLVAFLVTKGEYITGQVIAIDGGLYT